MTNNLGFSCPRPSRPKSRGRSRGAKHSRSGRRSGGKCFRPGPILRNPYLNFLRIFRKQNCGLTPIETMRRGAMAWRSLKENEKLKFIKEAFYAPKRKRHSRRLGSMGFRGHGSTRNGSKRSSHRRNRRGGFKCS